MNKILGLPARSLLRKAGGRAYGSARRLVSGSIRDVSYQLNWRYLANPRSMREFISQAPPLDAVQQRVLNDLRTQGISLVHFSDLFGLGGTPLFEEVNRTIREFADSPRVTEESEQYRQRSGQAIWKEYLIKLFQGERAEIHWHHPILQTAIHHRLLDVVSSYLGMWARMIHANGWYTVPIPDAGRARIASQRWHRDPEDRRLLKVFMFVNDVDQAAGPFEYVPSTRTDGPRATLVPLVGGYTSSTKYNYPSAEVVNGEIARSGQVVCTCPAGTFVLCDTSGFHRGGFALSRPRILGTWTYVSDASTYPRVFTVQGAPEPAQLDPAVRKALFG